MSKQNEKLEALVSTLGVHTPTPEQAAVITHPLTVAGEKGEVASPLLVVAGAGSGKTETMSLRAVYLAATAGVEDDAILGLTFTRKAAAELSGRLTERLAQLASSEGARGSQGLLEFEAAPVATTYNSFALEVVREFGPLLGMDGAPVHLDGAASWQLMESIVGQWRGELTGTSRIETVIDGALALRDDIANQGMTVGEARRALQRLNDRFVNNGNERRRGLWKFQKEGLTANDKRLELLDIVQEFDEQKAALQRIDYADQVLLATRIVRELDTVREELRDRHRVVFLDEFQDTSVAQMEFLSTLFADHPVTAVGDPNQAIYGWRGASAASLDDFHRLFTRNPEAPKVVLNLSTAWRNSRTILDVANAIAEPLRTAPPWASETGRKAWTASPTLEARRNAPVGQVRAVYRQTETEQVDEVLSFVEDVIHSAQKEAAPRPTVAVLCRRRHLIAPILERLRAAGIPAETNKAEGLLMHPSILDLRAALEIASNIGESAQLLRLLSNIDLGAQDLWGLGQWARKLSRTNSTESHPTVILLEAVDRSLQIPTSQGLIESALSAEGYRRLRNLAGQLRTIRRSADLSIVEQVELTRKALRLDEEAAATGQVPYTTEVLNSFSQAASEYQNQELTATMGGFLRRLRTAEEKERGLALPASQPDPQAVQVMTIHAAKGLEWDAVAVVDMQSGTFPKHDGIAYSEEEQEDGTKRVVPPPSPTGQSGWWTKPGALPYCARRDKEHLPDPPIWDPELDAGVLKNLLREDIGDYLLREERRLAYVAVTRPRDQLLLVGSWMTKAAKTPRYPSIFHVEAQDLETVTTEIDPCPFTEEIETLRNTEEFDRYPKKPGFLRKQVTLSAAMVRQELGDIEALSRSGEADDTSENPEATSPEVEMMLERVNDSWLSDRARFLITEFQEEYAAKKVDPRVRAEEDAKAASQGSPWEFSATRLHGAATAEDLWLQLRRPLPAEVFSSSALGTAFHQWVETQLRRVPASGVEMLGDHLTEDSSEPTEITRLLPEEDVVRFEKMQEQFLAIPWISTAEIIGIEVPFAFEMEEILVRGRIDAIFKDKETGEYWLIDWKTGAKPSSGTSARRIGEYLTQLGIYREAWRRRTGDAADTIRPKLVFVGGEAVQELAFEQIQAQHAALHGNELSLRVLLRQLRQRLDNDEDNVEFDEA